ncbi:hypothetical protein NXY46_28900 [Bacteroides ovatus]|nr:hypothetical protein [Bacteroides ovatus]
MFPSVHDFRLSHYGKECVHILRVILRISSRSVSMTTSDAE